MHRELSIQSNVTYVKGVESSSIYTIRAVMLCMSKVSKVVFVAFTQQYIQSNLTHVGGVESA